MLYNNTISKKCPFYVINFLTVQDKRKMPRAICSWKSERKLWLKFELNQFSSFKSVIVDFSFLHLFLDTSGIRIPKTDPDPGPNWMRIHPDPDPTHCLFRSLAITLSAQPYIQNVRNSGSAQYKYSSEGVLYSRVGRY
jgi:hypothetical protein